MQTEIDINEEQQFVQPQFEQQKPAAMSLASKINFSSPVLRIFEGNSLVNLREWIAARKSNIRPIGVFFATAKFQNPNSAAGLTKRVYKNLDYFQSNYVLVFLLLFVYCLVTSPLLLVVMGMAVGACYFISMKNKQQKITLAGHELSLAGQYGAVALCSIPLFLLAGAGGVVFWVLGASLFFISLHAAFYNYDALDVPEDQEPLTGEIVEEV